MLSGGRFAARWHTTCVASHDRALGSLCARQERAAKQSGASKSGGDDAKNKSKKRSAKDYEDEAKAKRPKSTKIAAAEEDELDRTNGVRNAMDSAVASRKPLSAYSSRHPHQRAHFSGCGSVRQVHQIKPATDRPADLDGSGFSESNRWEAGQLIEVAQEVRGGDPPEYKLAGACASHAPFYVRGSRAWLRNV